MANITRIMSTSGPLYGLVEDGEVYQLIGQNPFAENLEKGDPLGKFEALLVAPPIVPSKILCVGRNYAAHAAEMGNEVPKDPLIFLKPPTTLIGYDIPVQLPDVGRIDLEGELTIVIGKTARFVSEADALDYVLGYTCANDISARVLQKQDPQWWRAKGFDTFCPLGPWINTDIQDPSNLRISSKINGEIVQNSSTANMIHSVPKLIAHISTVMTLLPGDIILTGTPEGVAQIKDGDTVEVEIEGIGTLRNPIEDIE